MEYKKYGSPPTPTNQELDMDSSDVADKQTQQNFVSKLAQFAFSPDSKSPSNTLRRSPRKLATRPESSDLIAKKEDDDTVALGLKRAVKDEEEEDDEDVLPSVKHKRNSPKKKLKRGLASPEKYAHLHALEDNLKVELDIMFCGINPGVRSATIGHHFGNPTNHFWSCLHESGLTSRRLRPEDDHTLPEEFNVGLTNLVSRVTAEQNELSKSEQIASVSAFLEKVALFRPRIVCFIGLGIASVVESQLFPKGKRTPVSSESPAKKKGEKKERKTTFGLQSYKMVYTEAHGSSPITETVFFAVSSTSGRVVKYQKGDKVKQFSEVKRALEEIKQSSFDSSGLREVVAPLLPSETGNEHGGN